MLVGFAAKMGTANQVLEFTGFDFHFKHPVDADNPMGDLNTIMLSQLVTEVRVPQPSLGLLGIVRHCIMATDAVGASR